MGLSSLGFFTAQGSGSDSANAAYFNPGNANFATDGAATSANTTAPVFSSASYNFVSGDVAQYVFVSAGTNWLAGWYPVVSVASNKATLNAAPAATIAAAGVNYVVGDTITLSGGTETTNATYYVTEINPATGAVMGVSVSGVGAYTVVPSNPVSTTGGTGSGCTLTVNWSGTSIGGQAFTWPDCKPITTTGCATTASPTSATWGVDYSRTTSPRISFTDLVIGATTTQFTSAGNPVGKNFVGNGLLVTSGTGFTTGLFEIASTSGTTATCDRSLGTTASTGGHAAMGGSAASPGYCCGKMVNGNQLWVQTGSTYNVTTASSNVTVGVLIPPGQASVNQYAVISGYGISPGDQIPPTIKAGVASISLIQTNTAGVQLMDLILDGNVASFAGVQGVYIHSNRNVCLRVDVRNMGSSGFFGDTGISQLLFCRAVIGIATARAIWVVANGWLIYHCEISINWANGFAVQGGGQNYWIENTFYLNGVNIIGIYDYAGAVIANSFYAAASGAACVDNAQYAGGGNFIAINNSCYGSGSGYAFINGTQSYNSIMLGNAAGNFGTNVDPLIAGGNVAEVLTANPYTSVANMNFSPNTTVGGGALLRGNGYGNFPASSSLSSPTIGAIQPASSPGGYAMML